MSDARWRSGLLGLGLGENQCFRCTHYSGDAQCDAFPDEIPDEIFDDSISHTSPYEGDHGVQFEAVKGAGDAGRKP